MPTLNFIDAQKVTRRATVEAEWNGIPFQLEVAYRPAALTVADDPEPPAGDGDAPKPDQQLAFARRFVATVAEWDLFGPFAIPVVGDDGGEPEWREVLPAEWDAEGNPKPIPLVARTVGKLPFGLLLTIYRAIVQADQGNASGSPSR